MLFVNCCLFCCTCCSVWGLCLTLFVGFCWLCAWFCVCIICCLLFYLYVWWFWLRVLVGWLLLIIVGFLDCGWDTWFVVYCWLLNVCGCSLLFDVLLCWFVYLWSTWFWICGGFIFVCCLVWLCWFVGCLGLLWWWLFLIWICFGLGFVTCV